MSSPTKELEEPQVRELTREEARAYFDEQARELLGMSGEEFLRAYDAGEISNDPERIEVSILEMLIPFGRYGQDDGG